MPSNNRHSPANWKKVEIGYNYGRNETTKKNPQCVCVCLTLIYIHIYTRDKGCANLPGRITIGTSPTGETTKLISGYKDDRKVPCCILWMNSWNDFDSGGNVDLFAARIRSSSNDRIPDMLLVLILSGLMWLCFVLCRFLFKIAPLSVSFFFQIIFHICWFCCPFLLWGYCNISRWHFLHLPLLPRHVYINPILMSITDFHWMNCCIARCSARPSHHTQDISMNILKKKSPVSDVVSLE